MPSNRTTTNVSVVLAATMLLAAGSSSAQQMRQGNLPCLPVAEMNKFLMEEYNESPLIIMMTPTVSYVIYVRQVPERSWTSVGVSNGIACLLSNGDMWSVNTEILELDNKKRK